MYMYTYLFPLYYSSNKKMGDLSMELEQKGGASPGGSTSKLAVMSSPARSESDMLVGRGRVGVAG